jgi:hypothetical protein
MHQTYVFALIGFFWLASFGIFGWFSHWQLNVRLNAHHHPSRRLVPRIDPEELDELVTETSVSTLSFNATAAGQDINAPRPSLPIGRASSVNPSLSNDELALKASIFVNMAAYRDNK